VGNQGTLLEIVYPKRCSRHGANDKGIWDDLTTVTIELAVGGYVRENLMIQIIEISN